MILDTALAFSAVLVLCVISGWADSQGFVHASDIWHESGVSWTSLARSSLGFVVGIGSYWMSLRFMNRIGLSTADLQYLVWFLITLLGVSASTGSLRRWQGVDAVDGRHGGRGTVLAQSPTAELARALIQREFLPSAKFAVARAHRASILRAPNDLI